MYNLTNEQIEKINNYLQKKKGFFDSKNETCIIEEQDFQELNNEIKEKNLKNEAFSKVYDSIKTEFVKQKERDLKDLINKNKNNNKLFNQKTKIEQLKLLLLKRKQEFQEKNTQKEKLTSDIMEQEKEIKKYSNKKLLIEKNRNLLTDELIKEKKNLIEEIKKLKEKMEQDRIKERRNKIKNKVNKIKNHIENYLCINCQKEKSVIVYGSCRHLTYCKNCEDEIENLNNKYICPICNIESKQKFNVIYS